MELIKSISLLFLLLIIPHIARGGSDSEEIYEIDYRGPETHSGIPPPIHYHSHGNQPLIHGNTNSKSSLRGAKNITNMGKKVHG